MGSRQPRNSKGNYEKRISKELKETINNVGEWMKSSYPSLYISPEHFFAYIFDDEKSLIRQIVPAVMTTSSAMCICDDIKNLLNESNLPTEMKDMKPVPSEELKRMISWGDAVREEMGGDSISTVHVLIGAMRHLEPRDPLKTIFKRYNLPSEKILQIAKEIFDRDKACDLVTVDESTTIVLDKNSIPSNVTIATEAAQPSATISSPINFCTEMTGDNNNNPVLVGREKEIAMLERALKRKDSNSVILVGEHGVGKTAIVKGFARSIQDGSCRTPFSDMQIYSLKVSEIIGDTQYRGMMEKRFMDVARKVGTLPNGVLFIDNIHTLLDHHRDGQYDAEGLINDAIENYGLRIIATTTSKGYKNIEYGSSSMICRFQKIDVEEPSVSETERILSTAVKRYEQFHKVKFTADAVHACAVLCKRYITDESLPSSALKILDNAGADKEISLYSETDDIRKRIGTLKNERDGLVTCGGGNGADDLMERYKEKDGEIEELRKTAAAKTDELSRNLRHGHAVEIGDTEVMSIVSDYTGIPLSKIDLSERKALSGIDKVLKEKIIGQDEAVEKVTRAIKRNRVGLSPSERPIGSFLCIGSTGCGKTLMAKLLAKEVFGDEKCLVRFDMSEYADKTSVNKLIGASAGYIGYEDGGLLTEAVKKRKHAVLLIDEIEKADDSVFNIFLQVLDEGFLTDNIGQRIDFRNTIIIMTSNIGAKDAYGLKGVGFDTDDETLKKNVMDKSLKGRFSPEFLNRIDDIVYFNRLNDDDLRCIVILELDKLNERLKNGGYGLSYGNATVDEIMARIKNEKEYGARPIIRAIRVDLEDKITDLIIDGDIEDGHMFVAEELLK